MKTIFEKAALQIPKIFLPSKEINHKKWAVIACDQYTSHMDYWEKTAEFVEDSPSTLNIILPEVFLGTPNEELLIENIHASMDKYLNDGTLIEKGPGIFLCSRKTEDNSERKGLIACLDLEQYDFSKDSKSLIRPTEGTIVDRIPPRIKVREKAALESPHIMVLIDDPEKKVIEPLFEMEKEETYNFSLMNDSGSIQGYFINDEKAVNGLAENLLSLVNEDSYKEKYNIETNKNPLLFAMGDGNHSFATAKAWWEKVKKENKNQKDIMNHPARWALVEIVNIHDESIVFEPIHRVIFDINPQDIIAKFKSFWEKRGSKVTMENSKTLKEPQATPDFHEISFSYMGRSGIIKIENPVKNIPAGDLQDAVNGLCSIDESIKVDYIHGKNHLKELAQSDGNIGFLLPAIPKQSFFKSIIMDGTLPRKSFSMGESDDKRFYMECRKITE